MFFGKIFSTAVIGLTALAGIATASVVPVPVHQVESRAAVNSTTAALDIVTKFQSNVYGVLPKLVDYDRAGLDTTPVFKALFQYYDDTEKAILSLPPVRATSNTPNPTEKKLIDVTNETLNYVNSVANTLKATSVNEANKKILDVKTEAVVRAITITITITVGWIKITIKIIIRD